MTKLKQLIGETKAIFASALCLLSLAPSPAFAEFSGTATLPNGVKIPFSNVAATNWVGGELVLKWTNTVSSLNQSFTLPGAAVADVLVVGGGGAGGSSKGSSNYIGAGGGGGAGGLIESNDYVFATGTYTVSVGLGGLPGADASNTPGGNGSNSTIRVGTTPVFTAIGGGGGGAQCDGNSGGSGGGGSQAYASASDWQPHYGGAGTDGQGFAGGDQAGASYNTLQRTSAGGGGAGGAGGSASADNVGGAGGPGKASKIWNDTEIFYAGGGGGGARTGTGGAGGSGIGGTGGGGTSGAGTLATPGAYATGSGGGGGTLTKAGAAGGSGIVIVRISAAMDRPVATISDVTAQQRYPWNGKVDISYTVSGLQAAAKAQEVSPYLTVMAIDRATTPWTTNVADLAYLSLGTDAKTAYTDAAATTDGAHQLVWDLDKQGLSLVSTSVVFSVSGDVPGVQLWEGGPYWAECNVGAAKPQDYGYYFWWGDTVGYKHDGKQWNSVDGKMTGFEFKKDNCPTSQKDNAALKTAGYIDDTGNLVAAYDAATKHLGAPWRMPTDAEMTALTNNCTLAWTANWNQTGVAGRVVTGKGAYSGRSIFLPAAGNGSGSDLSNAGSSSYYWSSTPYSENSSTAWRLYFNSSRFGLYNSGYRYYGLSVRPLRGFAK